MKDFAGKYAVVTGGGSGMGRELVRQLVAEGCNVAMCDVSAEGMEGTVKLCDGDGRPQGTKIVSHVADVSNEAQIKAFRDAAAKGLETDKIHLLINNAGIGGGGSFLNASREEWERTFNICWLGVYYSCRAFIDMVKAADEAHIVNTSSINGFWACLGTGVPHTAYSAAKFAVKGFTEALVTDFRVNAPHIKCSIVMPGHIGTAIAFNSRKVLTGSTTAEPSEQEIALMRTRLGGQPGLDVSKLTDDQVKQLMHDIAQRFQDDAPTTASQAAMIILQGVRDERWRILVGEDAHAIDNAVRANPEGAYDEGFFSFFQARQAAQEKTA